MEMPRNESTTTRKKILFIIDAGLEIGMGHLARELCLAERLKHRYECFFYARVDDVSRVKFSQARYLHWIKSETDLNRFIAWEDLSATIVDTLMIPQQGMVSSLKDRNVPIVMIGNFKSVPPWVSACINPYTHGVNGRCSNMFTSLKYTILSREFERAREGRPHRGVRKLANRILVMAGGGNTKGMLFKILNALTHLSSGFRIVIVVGNFFTRNSELKRALKRLKAKIHLWKKIPPAVMVDLMKKADIAILSYGRSLDEARAMGLPALVLSSSGLNHFGSLSAEKRGGVCYLGDFRKMATAKIRRAVDELIQDAKKRDALSRQGRALIDGKGTGRVVNVIEGLIKRNSIARRQGRNGGFE
jgi:spore coat polysaccharide biosynthesis predicted glycosyltransferase SpsG